VACFFQAIPGATVRTFSDIGEYSAHHPKVVVGIAFGVAAVVTGGLALAPEAAAGWGYASLASGGVATALDLGPCLQTHGVACVGAGLGVTGLLSGLPGFAASFIPDVGGTWLGAIASGWSAFSLNVGIAGTLSDVLFLVFDSSSSEAAQVRTSCQPLEP
jgi:hypothetical protein